MRLIELELKNIRSYKKERVTFPNGLVLLSGDIGSGKSTILLAIEFALFGLRRGEVTGSSLLRHGAKEGKVALTLELDGETVRVERGLRRNATSVGQGPGKITRDGATTDLSAVELRSQVLALLNYPESLLAQTKSLVFRYTVYTPQEHMKTILFEKPEERLDTMRKLFTIDKYKQIRENATLVSRELRSSIERLRGQGDDLARLQQEQKELQVQQAANEKQTTTLATTMKEQEQELLVARKQLEQLEAAAKEREHARKQHAVMTEQLRNTQNNLRRLQGEIHALSEEPLQDVDAQKNRLKEQLLANETAQQALQEKIAENNKSEAKIDALTERIQRDAKNIADLDTCPTCKQSVTDNHKHTFTEEAEKKLDKIRERQTILMAAQNKLAEALATRRAEQKKLLEESETLMRIAAKIEAQKKNALIRKQKQEQEKELQEQLVTLKEKLSRAPPAEDETPLKNQREQTRRIGERYQQTQITHARHVEQTKALTQRIENTEQILIQKKQSLIRADRLAEEHEWLTKHFSNLMFTIEKHVLMTLYHQFNDAFKEWFDALIEDDAITVRLDHDFTPLVEQNGYETAIDHLSGGEKTSVALAYRLAINKVINQALQELRTDGLLILDEPTDGFSHEQLDRVQEVLSKLGLDQIIIVSHEPKMESFMDHVIRVTKNEHESKVH